MLLFYYLSFGQNNHKLQGYIVDENNEVLAGAIITLSPSLKSGITNSSGYYSIPSLQKGEYIVKVSFIGFDPIIDTINIISNTSYNAQLKVKTHSINEIVVTDNYAQERKKSEALNMEVVDASYLKQHLGGSLMNSLEKLAGVTTIAIGSGDSKPVIRGLGFNRVVVVENHLKHDAQQWGADHGLEIDQYAIDHIEVIKGPASLQYGSDAIGGVIDMGNKQLPLPKTFGGTIDLSGKTNNNLLANSINVFARGKVLYTDVRGTYIDFADYKVPASHIDIYSYKAALHNNQMRNTAGYEKNLKATLGFVKDQFHSKLFISSVRSKKGFFANAHGLEPKNVDTQLLDKSNRDINYPYQSVSHVKVNSHNQFTWVNTKLEFDLGFQRNFRQEWSKYTSHGYMPPIAPAELDFDPNLERQFEKYVYAANVKLSHNINDKLNIKLGTNNQFQDNRIDGRGFIIPAYKQYQLGGFIIGKYQLDNTRQLLAGVRFDNGHIKSDAYYDWFSSPVNGPDRVNQQYLQRAGELDRNFSNISWSVGYVHSTEKLTMKANIGKSFRIPIAKELAAHGVNYHRFSYEIGKPTLSPEISYQLDLGIAYQNHKFSVEVTPFVNYFSNYIYLNPTSEFDRLYGNGNQIFTYTESEVFRFGAELNANYQLSPNIDLGVIGEYVYSEQLTGTKKGFTLPFSPPASAIIQLKYHKDKIGSVLKPYASVESKLTAAQNRVVPPEEPTKASQVINMTFGGEFKLKQQSINLAFQVTNLFNTKYFNHTSFYRLINVPEPGRNFILHVTIPFTGRFN
jgi:iron complex outermembrane receptor protein